MKKLTYQTILDGAKLHEIYVTDDVYVACKKAIDIFHQGEIKKIHTGVFVPFMIGDELCRVFVCRYSGGDVRVNLYRVIPVDEWDAGYAVGFSNRPSKT